MARIRMFQTAAGPNGPFEAGKEYDVSGEIGSQYVSAGAAEWIGKEPKETATTGPTETRSEEDLSGMTKNELVALAEERGVDVERAEGEGAPLKADYVRALSA